MDEENNALTDIYYALLHYYGKQAWWPAEDAFEVMIGAILTQNTSWSNVEKAINGMKHHAICDSASLADIEHARLAEIIRSSGYYNQKALRLIDFTHWYHRQGGYEKLLKLDKDELRSLLLSVKGIGDETADDIVLYAFEKTSFVIDSYTRRIFSRLGLMQEKQTYQHLQAQFHQSLPSDVGLFKQYHGLIVAHAKRHCMKKPLCESCPLQQQCHYQNG